MKANNRQRSALLDEDRQRSFSKIRQIVANSSWAPLVLTLLFLISLSLTYVLIHPESHTGLTSTLLSRLPLLNNYLAFSLGLAAISLLGIMWLSPQKDYSPEQPSSPMVTPLLGDDGDRSVKKDGHSISYPIPPVASTNVPLQHIQRIPLYSASNQ